MFKKKEKKSFPSTVKTLALGKVKAEQQNGEVSVNPVFVETAPDTHMKLLCRESFYHHRNLNFTQHFLCTEKLEHNSQFCLLQGYLTKVYTSSNKFKAALLGSQ